MSGVINGVPRDLLERIVSLATPSVEKDMEAAVKENFGRVGNDPWAVRTVDARDALGELRTLLSEQPQPAPAGEREACPITDEELELVQKFASELQGMYCDGSILVRLVSEFRQLRAAWQRTQSAGVPEGYALVPVKPTPEMLKAMRERHWAVRGCQLCEQDYLDVHAAMLAAAPAHPAAQREWPDDEIVAAWKWCEENGGTPAEFLSHSLLVKRSRVLGRPLTWREAIELTAMTTNMPDEQRDKLLAIDDEPDAAAHDQGEVQRLREAVSSLIDIAHEHRHELQQQRFSDNDEGDAFARHRDSRVERINRILQAALAASTGQEVKP